jgi:hypothetical protein
MSNIVEFPLPTGMVSEEFIAELHSNAFRDLETSLRWPRQVLGDWRGNEGKISLKLTPESKA